MNADGSGIGPICIFEMQWDGIFDGWRNEVEVIEQTVGFCVGTRTTSGLFPTLIWRVIFA
jgi:hypothetical protein